MNKSVKLILTNSNYNLFTLLCQNLSKSSIIEQKKIVFCEDKVTLMAERFICKSFGGTFNTEVNSFGSYLLHKKTFTSLLSKEGSAMLVKKLLLDVDLKCFNASKKNLASTFYDLFIQLKSATVTPEQLKVASQSTQGILSDKLSDISKIYSLYEDYLSKNGLEDQSSMLKYLPEEIEKDKNMQNTEVFLVGYNSFTKQTRNAISSLLKVAKSVTAILVGGENKFAYVNESYNHFIYLCKEQNIEVEKKVINDEIDVENKKIIDGLFNPIKSSKEKIQTDKIYFYASKNPIEEAYKVASIIKSDVIKKGFRYRDFNVIIPQDDLIYQDCIKKAFDNLEIPYFIDNKKKVENHPLVNFVLCYLNVFRKGFSLNTILPFAKNPLICEDKNFLDKFENYLYKFNVNYERIKSPLTYISTDEVELESFENFRQFICSFFTEFNIKNALIKVSAEQKILQFSNKLSSLGQEIESAINNQVYNAVIDIINQISIIIGEERLNYLEYKNIFTSGINALELSIIPQYNDAVFVGDFKEISLSKSKWLFAMGLTSAVPAVKEDVALLNDNDINTLSQIKLLIEPEIKVVNHRARENTLLGISAFNERLYLSYSVADFSGNKNAKSEIISFFENNFTISSFPKVENYLTFKSGKKDFSISCGKFSESRIDDFTEPTTFYNLVEELDKDNLHVQVKKIIESANAEIKVRLENNTRILLNDVTSATALENYNQCPYRAFMKNALKVYKREIGEVNQLNIGNVIHEICKLFIEGVKKDFTLKEQRSFFDECAKKVLLKEEYAKLLTQLDGLASLTYALSEGKEFCIKMVKWLNEGEFIVDKTDLEVSFGDKKGCKYPSLKLLNGKVKLSGKIDRVDTYKNYCRVIDYKTGSVKDNDEYLFSGQKLQLFLYGAVVNKDLAGAYYLKVDGGYTDENKTQLPIAYGKTLDNQDVLYAQDKNLKTALNSEYLPVKISNGKLKGVISPLQMQSYINYALLVSELSTKRLEEGVIIPSPYENICQHCDYLAICGVNCLNKRKVNGINAELIKNSVDTFKKTKNIAEEDKN